MHAASLAAFLLLAASVTAADAPLPVGRCGGDAPDTAPPRDGKLLDLRESPILNANRQVWELAGYHADATGQRLLDSHGTPVTQREVLFLWDPWDASKEKLSLQVWNALMFYGYRLNETTCRLNGPDSTPLSRITIKYFKALVEKSQTQASLERLLSTIRALPPNSPVPANVRAMAEQMRAAGTPLPAEVLAVLQRPDATIAKLRGPAQLTYEGLQRFFDGQASLGNELGLAFPSLGGAAGRRAPYRDSAEQKFGRMLQRAFNAELSRNPDGADLLARFARDRRNGMPNVLVLKLTQRPETSTQGAVYDYSHDTMVINHWTVAAAVRQRTPPRKRARIEPLLSDPVKLMAFVSKDPALMKAMIQEIDVEYFHELIHADQSRRTHIDDEAVRGNTPLANPLDKEREAHRDHCHYLLSKASYDPAAVDSSRWRDYCVGMLRDPDAFQDEVTRLYLSTFAGSATRPEFLSMQEVRRAAANSPTSDWLQMAHQTLRKIGLGYGDKALADFNRDVRAKNAAFNAEIPAFRLRTTYSMAAAMLVRGRPERALQYRSVDPQWMSDPQAAGLVGSASSWVVKHKTDAAKLNDRLAVENIANAWLIAQKKPMSLDLAKTAVKDYRAAAALLLKSALAAPTGPSRQAAFTAAEAYAAFVHDATLVAKIRVLRNKK